MLQIIKKIHKDGHHGQKTHFWTIFWSFLDKEKKNFKNLVKLLLERTWNIIIESLFEMVKIGIGFGWFVWVSSRNEFHNILIEILFRWVWYKIEKIDKDVLYSVFAFFFWCELLCFWYKLGTQYFKNFLPDFFDFQCFKVHVLFFRC